MDTATSICSRRSRTLNSAVRAARVVLTVIAAGTLFSACGGGSEGTTETPPADQVRASFTIIDRDFTLLPSPRIARGPENATIAAGAGVRFSVLAAGLEPLTYRWHKNGVAIPGVAGAGTSYDVTNAVAGSTGSGGTYMVRVADWLGSTLTASATLSVVQNGWAQLGGRPLQSVSAAQQPSLALCAAPSLAHIVPSTNRNALYVKY